MNMLTGFSGNANEQIFFGTATAIGGGGYEAQMEVMGPPPQLFPGGQTGLNQGEWKMVDRPLNMGFFGMVSNPVLEFVPSGPQAVARVAKQMAVSKKASASVEEGVFMPDSIQAVGFGNVFNKPCPAGSTDMGAVCQFPEQWEECGSGEVDTGLMCQSGGTFDNSNPLFPRFTPLSIRQKKLTPMKIMPKF